ncbi:MAG: polysaccharide pyruvyl transferase family protein [Agathobacter sp.]|nr:polysaccharide pyruvyl transferase family protein [Agathobacter sp.]
MKKIGKITLFHNSVNYGGVLQAFALNHFLAKSGHEVYEFDYTSSNQKASKKKMLLHMIKTKTPVELLKKLVTGLSKKVYAKLHKKQVQRHLNSRKEAFDAFKAKHFKQIITCDKDTIAQKSKGLDVLIAGGDQIWKPTVANDAYMLAFSTHKNQTRFSYAASLAVDELKVSDQEKYRNWLKNLDGISVREEQAVELIQPLTDKKVHWVCDPILLLEKEEWLHFTENKYQFEPYIFCYFLGADKKHRELAKEYAAQKNLKIVTFPNLLQQARKVDQGFGDYPVYDASPVDLIELIHKAEFVLTDSFHATAFSVLLHTPFAVLERTAVYSMNSRITSLLKYVGLENRMIWDGNQLNQLSQEIQWIQVDEKINTQRKTSALYLENQIGGLNES